MKLLSSDLKHFTISVVSYLDLKAGDSSPALHLKTQVVCKTPATSNFECLDFFWMTEGKLIELAEG